MATSTAQALADPGPPPPALPARLEYLQYGAALSAESPLAVRDICQHAATCILGSGLGLGIRVGYRAAGPWYWGGLYEFSRRDSANLLKLALLQQLKAEARYYPNTRNRLWPYAAVGVGLAWFGSEWGADTAGLSLSAAAGLELELGALTSLGALFSYRPLVLRHWTDSIGERRADRLFGFGVAHFVCFELTFEVRRPFAR